MPPSASLGVDHDACAHCKDKNTRKQSISSRNLHIFCPQLNGRRGGGKRCSVNDLLRAGHVTRAGQHRSTIGGRTATRWSTRRRREGRKGCWPYATRKRDHGELRSNVWRKL